MEDVLVIRHHGRPLDILEPLARMHEAYSKGLRADYRDIQAFLGATYYGSLFQGSVSIHPADPETNEKHLVPVWFDPEDSIDRQLSEAGEMLVEERERWATRLFPDGTVQNRRPARKAGGPQLGSLPAALRIYDAVWRGAERKEIEEVVFCDSHRHPDKFEARHKAFGNALALARDLVAGGCRELLTRG